MPEALLIDVPERYNDINEKGSADVCPQDRFQKGFLKIENRQKEGIRPSLWRYAFFHCERYWFVKGEQNENEREALFIFGLCDDSIDVLVGMCGEKIG